MIYEYSGYLRDVLSQPGEAVGLEAASVDFSTADFAQWSTNDIPSDKGWKGIPVHRSRSNNITRLSGRFENVHRIDNLPSNRPGFWVALGTLNWKTDRLPIDTSLYPIIEITYRCTTENASPALVWMYDGGRHTLPLRNVTGWHTVAHQVTHDGFPSSVSALFLRLYSPSRTTETIEVQSIRFRAMTPEEQDALGKWRGELALLPPPKHYDILDEFMPLGVTMNATTARRQAEMLGVSLEEYWALALEDIVRHHHNCIALDGISQLTKMELDELLQSAETFDVKIVANHDLQTARNARAPEEFFDAHVVPYADSDTILAWGLCHNPAGEDLADLVTGRRLLEQADPNHPMAVLSHFTSDLALFAPRFSVSGLSFHVSHSAWDLGRMVGAHVPLVGGQQLWVEGPGHITASGAPRWNTCPELRLMVNLTFAAGARGWFSRSFHNDPVWVGGDLQRSLTGPFLAFSDLWSELDRCMERFNTVAPMILHATPQPIPRKWYVSGSASDSQVHLPEGVPPTSSYWLRGNDYNLFVVISNDVRGMTALRVSIPEKLSKQYDIYDITDFLRTREWVPMALERHIEMFPGQARIVLAGPRKVCEFWRDAIASRLIEDDRRQMAFSTRLAHVYGLDTKPIDELVKGVGGHGDLSKLQIMDRARGMLVDLIYNDADIAEARSAIIDATTSVCACDGALCRLVESGKSALAHEWGLKIIPYAREFTNLRLQLRRGRGAKLVDQTRDLGKRALDTLAEIRALTEPLVKTHAPAFSLRGR